MEKALSEIEGDMAILLRNIISKYYMTYTLAQLASIAIFNTEERAKMSFFIILQLLRTRNMRNFLTEFSEKAMTAFAKNHLPNGTLKNLGIRLNSTSHSLNHANLMFNEDLLFKLAILISQYNWYIGVNNSDQPFYTSDNPVSIYNHKSHQLVVGGLAKPGVEITLPLNSKLILIIRDSSVKGQIPFLENHFFNLNTNSTENYNAWQVIMAQRMIFCRDNDFKLARQIAKRHKKRKTSLGI